MTSHPPFHPGLSVPPRLLAATLLLGPVLPLPAQVSAEASGGLQVSAAIEESSSLDALGLHEAAVRKAREALEAARTLEGDAELPTRMAETQLGACLSHAGHHAEALPLLRSGIAALEAALGPIPRNPILLHPRIALVESALREGFPQEALDAARALRAEYEAEGATRTSIAIGSGNDRVDPGFVFKEARPELLRVEAEALEALDRLGEAEDGWVAVLELERTIHGPDHPGSIVTEGRLDEVRRRLGRTVARLRVGELGRLDRIRFEGNEIVPTEEIRHGLEGSLPFLTASHPAAPFAEFLTRLEDLVSRGYRHEGFPEARVRVDSPEGADAVTVVIEEGPRFLKGDIRVTGGESVDRAEFVRLLTEESSQSWRFLAAQRDAVNPEAPKEDGPNEDGIETRYVPIKEFAAGTGGGGTQDGGEASTDTSWLEATMSSPKDEKKYPFWKAGDPVSFAGGEEGTRRMEAAAALVRLGLPLAEFETRLVRDESTGTADLEIAIADEGPRARMREVKIVGSTVSTPDEIAAWLDLRPGLEIDAGLADRVTRRLRDSGRFLAHQVRLARRAASAEFDVVLLLKENPFLPPVSTPLLPEHEALVRFALWIEALFDGSEGDVVVEATGDENRTGIGGGGLRLVIDPDIGLLIESRPVGDSEGQNRFSLLLSSEETVLALETEGESNRYIRTRRSGGTITPYFNVVFDSFAAIHPASSFNFGIGASTIGDHSAPLSMQLAFDPAVFVSNVAMGRDAHSLEVRDGHVVATLNGAVLSLDPATGALSGPMRTGSSSIAEVAVRSERGAFADARSALLSRLDPADAFHDAFHDDFLAESPSDPFWIASTLATAATAFSVIGENAGALEDFSLETIATLADLELIGDIGRLTRILTNVLGDTDLSLDRIWGGTGDSSFTIPTDASDFTAQPNEMMGWVATMAHNLVRMFAEDGTWPTRLSREYVHRTVGLGSHTHVVIEELIRDPSVGPIGALATIQVLAAGDPAAADRLARKGLAELTTEAFLRDLTAVAGRLGDTTPFLERLTDALKGLDDEEARELVELVPEESRAAWRDRLAALREADSSGTARSLVDDAVGFLWEHHLRPEIEGRLRVHLLERAVSPRDPGTIASIVNGRPLAWKPILRETAGAEQAIARSTPDPAARGAEIRRLREETRANYETRELGILAFEKAGLTLPEELPVRQLGEIVSKAGGDAGTVASMLAANGMTVDDYLENMRCNLRFQSMQVRVAQAAPAPTEAEIAAFYGEHLATRFSQAGALVRLRTLTLSPERLAASPGLTAEIESRIADGADFAELAKAFSDDTVSDVGGDRGWQDHDLTLFSPALRDAAKSLEPGETSHPIEVGGNQIFVRLEARKPGRVQPLQEVHEAISEELQARKRVEAAQAWLANLRATAKIDQAPIPDVSAAFVPPDIDSAAEADRIRRLLAALEPEAAEPVMKKPAFVETPDPDRRGALRAAAGTGDARAAAVLAFVLSADENSPDHDSERARELATRAVEAGDPFAKALVAAPTFGIAGEEPDSIFVPEGALMDELKSRADQGDAWCAYGLARLLLEKTGRPFARTHGQGADWMRRAAEAGIPAAMHWMGTAFDDGSQTNGIAADAGTAFGWFQRAAEAGDPRSCFLAAACLETGHGVELDRERATALYEKGAELGSWQAMARLEFLHAYGLGVPRDEKRRRHWHEELRKRLAATGADGP